jgi:hypothetical protein
MVFTSEYSAWRDMKARCYRTAHKNYPQYGGRGISVCDRWRSNFLYFYVDMGPRPGKGYSIERRDNDGNYDPSNCKWADKFEQSRNRRGTWTAEEDRALRDLTASGCTFPEVSAAIGKPLKAVQARASRQRIRSGKPCNIGSYATPEVALQQGN